MLHEAQTLLKKSTGSSDWHFELATPPKTTQSSQNDKASYNIGDLDIANYWNFGSRETE